VDYVSKRKEKLKTERTIAICGFSPDTRELANQESETTELWGLNQAHVFLHRYDRWFQMHPRDRRRHIHGEDAVYGRKPDHLEFLKKCKVPVYMQQLDPEIPKSVAYPLKEVWESIAPQLANKDPYFTSTPAYMLALAIHEKATTIKIFGINFSTEPEYIGQRPNLEFLIGIAMGRGIKVEWPSIASLIRAPLYAYVSKLGEAEMAQERLDRMRDKFYGHHKMYHCCVGGYKELTPLYQAISNADGKRQIAERMGQLKANASAHFDEMKQAVGQMREAGVWLSHFGAYDINADALPSIEVPDEFAQPGPPSS